MKIGHFVALALLVLTLLFGGLLYWDLQDGEFQTRLPALLAVVACEAVAFTLFPGGSATFQQLARPGSRLADWGPVPPLHRRVWLVAGVLGFCLGSGLSDWLEGKGFFSWDTQIISLLVAVLPLWWALRQARQ